VYLVYTVVPLALFSPLEPEQAAKESLMLQIANGSQMVKLEKDPDAAFALIIDGKALTFALEDDMKHMFLNLATECASVICCRVSPRQKALVTSSIANPQSGF
jgi:phospholipid-translocating ATPase